MIFQIQQSRFEINRNNFSRTTISTFQLYFIEITYNFFTKTILLLYYQSKKSPVNNLSSTIKKSKSSGMVSSLKPITIPVVDQK